MNPYIKIALVLAGLGAVLLQAAIADWQCANNLVCTILTAPF